METMERTLADLDERLKSLRRGLDNAWAVNARRHRDCNLTKYQVDIALRTYVLSSYDMDAALAVLLRVVSKRRGATTGERDAWRAIVEEAFLSKSPNDLARMSDWAGDDHKPAARTAKKLLHEYRLKTWVCRQNVIHGHAPNSALVLSRRHRGETVPDVYTVAARGSCAKSEYQWILRWRRRWGGRVSKIRVQDPIGPEVALDKAFRL